MERHFWRAAGKMAACALLLISLTISSQPCFGQYTAGHTSEGFKCLYDKDGNVYTVGATNGSLDVQEACPQLQGATMGTIGPQGLDATYVVGVNTAGMVRMNMLANLEALLNIVANGAEIITVLWGSLLMIGALLYMFKMRNGIKRCLVSTGVIFSFLLSGLGIITNLLNCAAFAFDPPWKHKDKVHVKFWMALLTIKLGLSIPGFVNWLVAMARDANLFS